MSMDTYVNGVGNEVERPLNTMDSVEIAVTSPNEVKQIWNSVQQEGEKEVTDEENQGQEKEPAMSTIESAISGINSQITSTRCAYSYDEDTKRITIKVYDEKTDELIREVPPEKSLEVLKKVWEIAGIIIDEKR